MGSRFEKYWLSSDPVTYSFSSRMILALRIILFTVEALFVLPFLVPVWLVEGFGVWVQNRRPNSRKAQTVGFWVKLLAPVIVIIPMICLLRALTLHLRYMKGNR
jgi:hypothetical protein